MNSNVRFHFNFINNTYTFTFNENCAKEISRTTLLSTSLHEILESTVRDPKIYDFNVFESNDSLRRGKKWRNFKPLFELPNELMVISFFSGTLQRNIAV